VPPTENVVTSSWLGVASPFATPVTAVTWAVGASANCESNTISYVPVAVREDVQPGVPDTFAPVDPFTTPWMRRVRAVGPTTCARYMTFFDVMSSNESAL
jgi:hypothetical protein